MKIAASSAATSADGLWKEPMHGSGSFADCWFVTSICSPFTTPSFTLPASGLHSGGIFETSSTKILRNQGMTHLDELVRKLRAQKNPALEHEVAEAMTINETSFFRDLRPFDLLREALLPKIIEARRFHRTLRFWSAACATGQEAYSLAMMLLEHFPMLAGWKLAIEGTDISREVVQRAQAGLYHRI